MKKNSRLRKIKRILEEVKSELKKVYGIKLKDVILYGSYARGDEKEDSDIDLAVILKGEINIFEEIDRIIDATYDIGLKHSILLSVKPISENDYNNLKTPFLLNVKQEGFSI
jgi:predicted nucleotidyltransferase